MFPVVTKLRWVDKIIHILKFREIVPFSCNLESTWKGRVVQIQVLIFWSGLYLINSLACFELHLIPLLSMYTPMSTIQHMCVYTLWGFCTVPEEEEPNLFSPSSPCPFAYGMKLPCISPFHSMDPNGGNSLGRPFWAIFGLYLYLFFDFGWMSRFRNLSLAITPSNLGHYFYTVLVSQYGHCKVMPAN